MATNCPSENSGRDNCNKRWEALSEKLNTNGPPIKNVKAWKKTWADHKHRAKKKIAINKNSLSKTGGGPYKEIELSPFEDAVVELAKIKAAVLGISDVKSFCGENNQQSLQQKPPTRPSSSSSSTDSEDDVENLLKDLMSDKNSEASDKCNDIFFSASEPCEMPKSSLKITPPKPREVDKLELFKMSANSSEEFHKKLIDILLEIRDLKKEKIEILRKQTADILILKRRKLVIREQELKVAIRTNELKEYELGLRT